MNKEFDLIAIGGGSGGIATVVKAAQLGARCAIIEAKAWGGTCVNVGCVPKKLMWLASEMALSLRQAPGYGFKLSQAEFDWPLLIERRQAYIQKLHAGYQSRMQKLGISQFEGYARFVAPGTLQVEEHHLEAPHIVIATGGKPTQPRLKGAELGIDSDGFFALEQMPKRAAVIGAGYIAVELAGILQSLGCETSLVFRHNRILRQFDQLLSDKLMPIYQQHGMILLPNHTPTELSRSEGKLSLSCEGHSAIGGLDQIIWAVGRSPNTQGLGLEHIGVNLTPKGTIVVDHLMNTSVPGVYAIGDIIDKKALTPVAIAQGRRLAARLFGSGAKAIDYADIATVIFSHPPIGTVGLSEAAARKAYGDDVKIYQSQFTSMGQALSPHPVPTALKLVTLASSDKVIGCHLIGDSVDEILQGFAVAIHMGATKADLDDTIAIHPTVAEELVTMT